MMIVPRDDDATGSSTLIFILQKDNVDRMQKADSITLFPCRMGGFLPRLAYPENTSVVIAYEDDTGKVMSFVS